MQQHLCEQSSLGAHCLFTFLCLLLVLMLYISVNNFSIMSGHFPVFLGGTSAKQRIKCLDQGHNIVPLVYLKQATLQSQAPR